MNVFKTINKECDLLIICGTALAVKPFCNIIDVLDEKVPKVLINMTLPQDYNFNDKVRCPERIFLEGKCDETIAKLTIDCGWAQEFSRRLQKFPKAFSEIQEIYKMQKKEEESKQDIGKKMSKLRV